MLKVTNDPDRMTRAMLELKIYREASAALREFMPTLRAGGRDDDGVYLLLEAMDPYLAAPSLTQPAWLHLATQLGRLHSAPMITARSLQLLRWPTDPQVDEARRLSGARTDSLPCHRRR